MINGLFPISYLIGLIVGSFIRVWYGKRYKQDRTAIFRTEGLAVGLLASLWGITILIPVFYMFTHWLDFANYDLPAWAGWSGVAIFAFALWLLWRSHTDLGRNWSATTEIKEKQTLVTDGVFRFIRHPMYAAHLLWCIAQALLIWNWIAGLASMVVFVPLYFLRFPREECMMLDQFGEEYRQYMSQTGRIIPPLRK